MAAISTEGRNFAAQMMRHVNAHERAGADALTPGTKRMDEALIAWATGINKIGSTVKAGTAFRAGLLRLQHVQQTGACFVNSHLSRGRSWSGRSSLLGCWPPPAGEERSGRHHLRAYHCSLRRNGSIWLSRSNLAFCSWHALGRMAERSKIDIFTSRGIVVGCGFAGLLLRESEKHANTAVYLANDELLCAGVLRIAPADDEDSKGYRFFDVLTAFRPNEEGPQVAQWKQGCAITAAVNKYLRADDADPAGYGDDIAVLPARNDDFISTELRRV